MYSDDLLYPNPQHGYAPFVDSEAVVLFQDLGSKLRIIKMWQRLDPLYIPGQAGSLGKGRSIKVTVLIFPVLL